ncbi:MAG: TauD/TfdA family dioxygenase [Raineya sp.]|jgi:alpha-ketoglutarate-dependent taurine dioxygenase|nr:TauD/TfdA family dioxygenase [Raineya sp.]
MKEELLDKGFLHLVNQSEESLKSFINSLGEIIFTTDVIIKPDSKGMITSARGLDFHTDHHKAKYIVWYCYKQTDKGGESILIDAESLYEQLPKNYQEQLKGIELFEHKIFPDDKESYPFIAIDENGKKKFYYSFWLVKNEDKQNPAMLELQKLIRQTEPIKLKLKEKDILVVDNHRVFHGRTPIEGSKDRFLKRFWILPHQL